ncbi:MAG: AAA family ATPase [Actinomycetes bacterium]
MVGTGNGTRLVETHTATLLLVGDRVLKWKKPVVFDFVDFSTLEARRRACEAEVTLNRRLAPDVYEGVATLRAPDGSVMEHVVVMRRLPAEAALSRLAVAGSDLRDPVRALAHQLAAFHSRCAPAPYPHAVAGVERLCTLWDAGLDVLAEQGRDVVDRADVHEARQLVHAYLAGRRPLIDERISRGLVRDGHGDLLADDVFVLPDGVRVLDCLDFDPALRAGDVLLDVASLAMDLERLGRPGAAVEFLQRYSELSAENHPGTLEDFFVAYRAQVRAKVALLRAGQRGDEASEQRQQAGRLSALMLDHLRRAQVRLVLVGGLPGTGGSTVAEGLAESSGWLVHSSDLVRRELDLPADERYTQHAVDQVYAELLRRARRGLERGWSVVLDATWTDDAQRRRAQELADETSSVLVPLVCDAPAELARMRLAQRGPDHVSDADAAVHRLLAGRADPWPQAIRIDTSRTPDDAVQQALTAVSAGRPAPSAARAVDPALGRRHSTRASCLTKASDDGK